MGYVAASLLVCLFLAGCGRFRNASDDTVPSSVAIAVGQPSGFTLSRLRTLVETKQAWMLTGGSCVDSVNGQLNGINELPLIRQACLTMFSVKDVDPTVLDQLQDWVCIQYKITPAQAADLRLDDIVGKLQKAGKL